MNKATVQHKQFNFSIATLIVGMGGSGLSCARYLNKRGTEFSFADAQTNSLLIEKIKKEFPQSAYFLGEFNIDDFSQFQQIIVSPGISIRSVLFDLLRDKGCFILGDIELFTQVVDKPVIAITGSNGKSTVTTLVEKIANRCGVKAIAGGNLGIPALDLLESDSDLYILELSSFQLETTFSLKTLSATVLNVTEDHMDRYDDIEDYRQVKERIFRQTDHAVVNGDDAITLKHVRIKQLGEEYAVIVFSSQLPEAAEYGLKIKEQCVDLVKGKRTIISSNEMKMVGQYNYLNVLAALALLEPLNLDKEKQLEAIKEYSGLEHRCEWVIKINDVEFYNDSKGTNTGATIAAIDGFDDLLSDNKVTILIAGGMAKDADFTELGKVIQQKVKSTVLLGVDSPLIKDCALQAGAKNDSLYMVNTMEEAVLTANKLAEPGDVILFSPACASFDMYQNYQQRGRDFKEKVGQLAQQKGVLKNVS